MPEQIQSKCINSASSVTVLVGENGSGKSRRLGSLVSELLKSDKRVIAISNTTFDRFPRFRRLGYSRLSPSVGRRYAVDVFKRALVNSQSEPMRNASLIGKTLEYTGFNPVIGLHIRTKKNADYESLHRILSGQISDYEIPQIIRALEIYRNYENDRQSAWIDLYGSQFGPDRREIFPLLQHELRLKKLGIVERISITLERKKSYFDLDDASSGELSLLCSYAYIASQIQHADTLLIDEPENSLHPRWQRDYCRRLLDQFHYYEPHLIIATHSPHIVQGAQSAGVDVHLVKLPLIEEAPRALTKSIEGTLLEAFGVLSPASHYLSEKVTHILNELVQNRSTLGESQAELRALKELSDDEDQKAFLDRSIDLAEKVQTMAQEPGG